MIPLPDAPEAPEYASSESDVDESISSATQNLHNNTVTQDQAVKQKASDDDSSSDDDTDITTRTSSRQKHTPATFKARPENPNAQKKENLLKQYNSNKEYANDRNSILDNHDHQTLSWTRLFQWKDHRISSSK